MTRGGSEDDGILESETGPDLDCNSNTDDYWDGVFDSRIDYIGSAPSPQRYSNATISSIEALDKEKRFLEDAMAIIRSRCANERRATQSVLAGLSEHLEHEERAIAQSVAIIHHHRNRLIPIMRLPPEILSRILVFHAQIEWRWLDAALTTTHVCRRWWQVGQACPTLWSHIDYESCHSATWMETMIERSRAIPVSLTIGSSANMRSRKMALVSSNFHRFKSLNLSVPSHGAFTFFRVFSQLAPLLQNLRISGRTHSTFVFPPEFLGGSAPNLRHMKLSTSSYIPWDSGLFSNLVTLEVDGFRVESADADSPSLDMLLSALTRMPGLELIILQYCLPPPTPVRTTHAYVDLPNLKRLEVVDPLTCCACFLRQITINASAIVALNFKGSNISKADVEEFFTIFPSCLHTALTPIAQALKFTWGRYCGFVVEIWTTQQNTEVRKSRNACIKLCFNWESGISLLDLAWACFVALASPQLRSFRISTGHIAGWNAEVWRRLARLVPDLRRLAVETEVQYTEVCKALSPPDEPGAVPADCCFPALSYLELEPPFDRPPPTPDEGESLLSVALARSLAARASIGCSTPELVFVVSCKEYPEGWFDPLRNAVPGILVRVEQWLAEDM